MRNIALKIAEIVVIVLLLKLPFILKSNVNFFNVFDFSFCLLTIITGLKLSYNWLIISVNSIFH